jgi:hypothetical protein
MVQAEKESLSVERWQIPTLQNDSENTTIQQELCSSTEDLESSSDDEFYTYDNILEAANEEIRKENSSNIDTSLEDGFDSTYNASWSYNIYVAKADYQGSKDDGEVDLFKSQQVKVLHKTSGGWWLVQGEEKGWAPSNFLEETYE